MKIRVLMNRNIIETDPQKLAQIEKDLKEYLENAVLAGPPQEYTYMASSDDGLGAYSTSRSYS